MKRITPLFSSLALLLTLTCLSVAPVVRAEIMPSPTVGSVTEDVGADTLRVTCTGTNKFSRSTEKLKAAAVEEATRYCAQRNKQLKIVNTEEHKGAYLVGSFPSVTLVFKAVDTAEMDVAPEAGRSDDLYTSLVKLDDLRKKGILTDEEFQSEKKKVLNRSK